MQCWQCETMAKGVCNFCGRGVCKEHAKRNTYILAAYDEEGDYPKVIAVDDALWCGQCKPLPEPIDMPEIEGEVGGRKE